jgi:hypothetical protein
MNKLSMRIGSVTGNSGQGSQGKEKTLTNVITCQMTSTEKRQITWHEEKNKYHKDQKTGTQRASIRELMFIS